MLDNQLNFSDIFKGEGGSDIGIPFAEAREQELHAEQLRKS
ncbi:MAG: hypothetical protein Rsou_1643 [Candidatus Ruthia sp. Asou_11_S2]|nr:hypothetical protein [Candidatus Ruthia sp. Asou_11_S2]